MTRTIEQVKKEIEQLTNYMRCQEIGNDFYYTRGSYEEDRRELNALKKELQMLENNGESK